MNVLYLLLIQPLEMFFHTVAQLARESATSCHGLFIGPYSTQIADAAM
jgi:hypothetical protein